MDKENSLDDTADRYRAPALEKGLDILELLANHSGGLSKGEVARALERSPNEIYRMLSTLLRRGYISQSSSGDRYGLSLRMFSLSHKHPPVNRLIEIALPQIRAVTRKIWQSCHLAMENNGEIVIVASVESPGYWSLALRTGSVMGLGNTGSGRVMAAFRPRDEINDLLLHHSPTLGEPTIDQAAFFKRLDSIRAQGFEALPSDTAAGITNIAFPILDLTGRSVAVVSCPYLARIDDLEIPGIPEVQKVIGNLAHTLSNQYGGAMPGQKEIL